MSEGTKKKKKPPTSSGWKSVRCVYNDDTVTMRVLNGLQVPAVLVVHVKSKCLCLDTNNYESMHPLSEMSTTLPGGSEALGVFFSF